MTAYALEWLNLLLRWGHLITGIAWIGSSFYFVWLDNSLETPSEDNAERGVGGQLSSIHAGGFYEVAKYSLAPPVLPATLHWFKWEAYSTWITGFFLLVLMFYVGAETYLIDPGKQVLSTWQAVGLSLGTLTMGWLIYHSLCRSRLANIGWLLALVLLALLTMTAWGLGQLFSDRAAYLHVGALMGTCMAANVFFVIMPGQRALVRAVELGQKPDAKYAIESKLRSVHNNYLTLPVLFLMISSHYPLTYSHPNAWAVLMAITLIAAWTRHFFNLRHRGKVNYSILVSAAIALLLLAWAMAPPPSRDVSSSEAISDHAAMSVVEKHCTSCHSDAPSDQVFTVAPGGVMLHTKALLKQWKVRVAARAVQSHDMPMMNKTEMTEQERALLGLWLQQIE